MADVCAQCKTRRIELYWNVLPDNKHHFFKLMLGNFRRFLRIPRKFCSEFKGTLLRKVILQGPSGNRWTATLEQGEQDLVLQNGWQKFAEDHILDEGDLLVFKYVEDSVFEVLIFDPSGCEKEVSHFAEPNAESCCSRRNNMVPNKRTISSDEGQSDVRRTLKRKECDEEIEIPEENSGSEWSNASKRQCTTTYYKSGRRSVTKEDIERAFRLASKHSAEQPSCKIKMKPSHVHHLFILTIPKDFANNCLRHVQKCDKIKLRVGEKTWPVSLTRRTNQCTLNKGWAKFVLENNLETEDMCVLELAPTTRKNKGRTTLDVHIFRVVDEIVPLQVVKPSQAV